MRYGVVFPQTEIGSDAGAVRSYALAAENLGYDYLLAYDHVVGANPANPGPWQHGPYDYTTMFHEPLVLFGHLAALTERIAFATGILILPQRQTALVAKQAAEVDVRIDARRWGEDVWPETLERLEALNVTHVCINTMGLEYTPDQHIEAIGRFKAVVDSVA
jgi:hypothetical protein